MLAMCLCVAICFGYSGHGVVKVSAAYEPENNAVPAAAAPRSAGFGAFGVCSVYVTIPGEYNGMGSFAVFAVDTDPDTEEKILTGITPEESSRYEFPAGTLIEIHALPNPFHEFVDFKQNFKSERASHEILSVEVRSDREFFLLFKKKNYIINEGIISSGVVLSTNQFKLGDEIYVSLTLDSMFEVKDFKINGISVNHPNYTGEIKFANNIATIIITEDWLGGYLSNLDVVVTTKLNDMFLIALITASTSIPLLILLTVFLLAIGKRQRKAARHALQVKQVYAFQTDTGSFIKGLKDGSFTGQFTDKDIKAELKSQSKDPM